MSVDLQSVPITSKELLRNLYSLYLHDLSAYSASLHTNEKGVFEFEGFEKFWDTEGLEPFFIKYDRKVVGFILLVSSPLTKKGIDYMINDFFVLNAYRGKGVAKQAVKNCFTYYKGHFYISQLKDNDRAISFWKKAYEKLNIEYKEYNDVKDDEQIVVQEAIIK